MAETIISPGVFSRESDQTVVSKAPFEIGAAIVGPTVNGAPFVPTYVFSYSDYLSKFGDVFQSGSNYYEYFTSLAAREYFNNGGRTLLVTRVVSSSYAALSSSMQSYASASIESLATSASSAAGAFASRSLDLTGAVTAFYSASFNGTFITLSGSSAQEIFTRVSSSINSINDLTASFSTPNLTVSSKTKGFGGNFYFIISGSTTLSFSGGSGSLSLQLESLNWGDVANNAGIVQGNGTLLSGSLRNVRWEINAVDYTNGTFTLLVRRGDDTSNQKNILESWTNLSLDPMQPNFISRVIGDKKSYFNVDSEGNYFVNSIGSYDVKSQYIRVKSVPTLQVNSLDNNGAFLSALYSGSLPLIGSGSLGGSFNNGLPPQAFTSSLLNESITATNIQGIDVAAYVTASNILRNKDEYQFNILLAPGITLGSHTAAAQALINVCEDRGDAIAIVDPSLYGTSITNAKTAALNSNSNYAAAYWPWVQIFSTNLGRAVWVPSSTVVAGAYAYNDSVSAEWFAPAGLNRGIIPSVVTAERKIPQADRDNLYLANINPVATFPGQGTVIYGQKTLQKKSSALDRVNVRRLLISLKRYIGVVAANLVFEQNTNATRNKFLAQVNPYLDSIVQKQGIYAYKVVMDDTNNTPDVIDRNQLIGSIQIQPTKTVEFVVLTYNILPTGVTFG